MSDKAKNIAKAEREGYSITTVKDRMWLIVDDHGDCHGYYDTARKADNAMARIGSYYS